MPKVFLSGALGSEGFVLKHDEPRSKLRELARPVACMKFGPFENGPLILAF